MHQHAGLIHQMDDEILFGAREGTCITPYQPPSACKTRQDGTVAVCSTSYR